jgi:hypothetical protein
VSVASQAYLKVVRLHRIQPADHAADDPASEGLLSPAAQFSQPGRPLACYACLTG